MAIGLALGSQAAEAQIVPEKPAQVKAANRRALREARHTTSPYKDSHLGVTAARLKRGQSTQHVPKGSDELKFEKVATPKANSSGFRLGRRKKSS